MNTLKIFKARSDAMTVALLLVGLVASAGAQDVTVKPGDPTGRIEFDYPGAAKATVEVDLTREMFGDLFGISDAALAGVAEALGESPEAKDSEAIRQAAAKAAAAREVIGLAKDLFDEVRIRVYQGLQADDGQRADVLSHYDEQLTAAGWDTAVRVREGDKGVRVAMLTADGSIKGVFVSAIDGNDLVLVNVTGNVSPENTKKLTEAAVKSGLQAGLAEEIEKAMHKHRK